MGLATTRRIAIGRTRRLILRPTPEARRLLGLDRAASRESVEHEFWKHHYAQKLTEAGYSVEVEAPRKGGRVDLLVQTDRGPVGFEVEMGNSTIARNVSNCLRSRFGLVVVVTTSDASRNRVERELAKHELLIRGRVVVVLRDGFAVGDVPWAPASEGARKDRTS